MVLKFPKRFVCLMGHSPVGDGFSWKSPLLEAGVYSSNSLIVSKHMRPGGRAHSTHVLGPVTWKICCSPATVNEYRPGCSM